MARRSFGTVAFMRKVVCPGSFDPIHNGHLDIVARAAKLFDEVTVAVLVNESKKGLFTLDERLDILAQVTSEFDNVKVDTFKGLLVDYCAENSINAIVKGLRAVTDFDYELQMAQMNSSLTGVDTLFIPTNPVHSYIASSLVKEIARNRGDVSALVPGPVRDRLNERFGQ